MKILASHTFDWSIGCGGGEYIHTYKLVELNDGSYQLRYQAALTGIEVDSSTRVFDATPSTVVSQFNLFMSKITNQ